jgi:hypothetical protein
MVWLFERDDQAIRVETSYDRTAAEYLLIQEQQDGSQRVERFRDEVTFRTRLEELERQLDSDHWARTGPFLLRDGWKL